MISNLIDVLHINAGALDCDCVDTMEKPLEEAIQELLRLWREEDGPQLFVLVGSQSELLATVLVKEESVVTFANGEAVRYRCDIVPDGNRGHQVEVFRMECQLSC